MVRLVGSVRCGEETDVRLSHMLYTLDAGFFILLRREGGRGGAFGGGGGKGGRAAKRNC